MSQWHLFDLRPTMTLGTTAVIQGLHEDFVVSRNPSSLGEMLLPTALSHTYSTQLWKQPSLILLLLSCHCNSVVIYLEDRRFCGASQDQAFGKHLFVFKNVVK